MAASQQAFALDSEFVEANPIGVAELPSRESREVNRLTKNAPEIGRVKKNFFRFSRVLLHGPKDGTFSEQLCFCGKHLS